jgi:hypothetical protein
MRKAVALWEQLEQNTPDVYRPNLVGLFTILNAIGRYLEAENKIRKATEIFCLLAANSPELFNPWRAAQYSTSSHGPEAELGSSSGSE